MEDTQTTTATHEEQLKRIGRICDLRRLLMRITSPYSLSEVNVLLDYTTDLISFLEDRKIEALKIEKDCADRREAKLKALSND
jgi:hypothetical protein